jgi:hypothetical protein
MAFVLALAAAIAAPVRASRAPPVGDATDFVVTGKYELLGQAPIAAAHQIQLPCGSDQFLVMGEHLGSAASRGLRQRASAALG